MSCNKNLQGGRYNDSLVPHCQSVWLPPSVAALLCSDPCHEFITVARDASAQTVTCATCSSTCTAYEHTDVTPLSNYLCIWYGLPLQHHCERFVDLCTGMPCLAVPQVHICVRYRLSTQSAVPITYLYQLQISSPAPTESPAVHTIQRLSLFSPCPAGVSSFPARLLPFSAGATCFPASTLLHEATA